MNVTLPRARSLCRVSAGWTIEFPHRKPNAWWRFWHYLFFGFRWEDL